MNFNLWWSPNQTLFLLVILFYSDYLFLSVRISGESNKIIWHTTIAYTASLQLKLKNEQYHQNLVNSTKEIENRTSNIWRWSKSFHYVPSTSCHIVIESIKMQFQIRSVIVSEYHSPIIAGWAFNCPSLTHKPKVTKCTSHPIIGLTKQFRKRSRLI